ncbi:MAG: hypothetical protein RMI79_03815 [Nitrososphaerota archaeon]|nr:hypothetical protein [Nitrososphaerota archaeon]
MNSPLETPTIDYRMPEVNTIGEFDITEQDLNILENIFKRFFETEYEKLLMPPLFAIEISENSISLKAKRETKIVPTNDNTVILTGHPCILLVLNSYGVHGITHMRQMSRIEVMQKYIDAEVAIYSLMSILKASMGKSIGSLVKLGMEQGDKSFKLEDIELEEIIENIRKALPYMPFRIDRDKLVLLESISLLNQFLTLEKPEVKKLRGFKKNISDSIHTRIMKILTEDVEKSIYLESIGLVSALSEILPKTYLNLLFYAGFLTNLGAQGILSLAKSIACEEKKVKVLAMLEREVESGGNRLELMFEYNVFDYENFVNHKENLIRIIDDGLEICRRGRPFQRLKYVRQKLDSIKTPSELQLFSDSFSQTIFSSSPSPEQPPIYYIHSNGSSCNREDAMLFSSLFADYLIATNILNALSGSRNGNTRNILKNAIRCPFRRAPQMKCVWNPECEHEKEWLDFIGI